MAEAETLVQFELKTFTNGISGDGHECTQEEEEPLLNLDVTTDPEAGPSSSSLITQTRSCSPSNSATKTSATTPTTTATTSATTPTTTATTPTTTVTTPTTSATTPTSRKAKLNHFLLLAEFFFFNILLLIVDIGTDVATAVDFYSGGHPKWCFITSALVISPFLASLLLYGTYRIYQSCGTDGKQQTESFANVFWQFPLFHPIKNIRLFVSLACMETQLSVNSSLISKIKGEALPFGLFEAFLESAPQFIFQLSLVLRTGFITPVQIASIVFSLGSLTLSSIKLFYSQRLGRYRDVDPGIKHIAFVAIWILLQNIGFLLAWIFITAYLQEFTVLCVIFVMASVFFVLQTFVFGWDTDTMMLDAVCDRVPEPQRHRETLRTFSIAVFTSWVSPCTVWSNNKGAKEKRNDNKINSSKFLIVTAITSAVAVMLCLVLGLILKLETSSDSFTKGSNSPVTHCFEQANSTGEVCVYYVNETIQDSQDCIYLCPDSPCSYIIRLCNKGELPTDMLYKQVFPILVPVLILIILISSFVLQMFGDYGAMFHKTLWFKWPIVHSTLVNEWLVLKNHKKLLKKETDTTEIEIDKVKQVIDCANKKCLRKPDPITGDTCLHVAFQKCLFEDVRSMINLKGNPFQKNNEGESIDFMLQLCSNEKIKELMDRVGSNIFYQKRKSSDGKEFILKLFMHYCEQLKLKGKATIQDHEGNFQLRKEVRTPCEVVLAICLLKETGDRIEHSVKYLKNDEIIQTHQIFQDLSKLTFASVSSLTSLHVYYQELQHKINSDMCINVCCTNILHKIIKNNKSEWFNIWHKILGANPDAKNANNETPLQILIETLELRVELVGSKRLTENSESMKTGNQVTLDPKTAQLVWIALKNGAASFAKNEEQKKLILNLVEEKCFNETNQNVKVKKIPPNMKEIFFYCASKGQEKTLCKFLKYSYTVHDTDNSKRTALHYAVKGQNLECMTVLLLNGSEIDAKDIYRQAPIHFAAKEGHFESLKLLVDEKANINAKGQFDLTALHFAVQKGHLDCVALLVQKGSNVNAKDQNNQTPLHAAAKNGNILVLKTLIEESKKLILSRQQLITEDKGTKKERKKSKSEGKDQKQQQQQGSFPKVNSVDKENQTPLHLAAKHGSVECVKYLLDQGASVTVKDKNGMTAADFYTSRECSEAIRAAASIRQSKSTD